MKEPNDVMMKAWPQEGSKYVYDLMCALWKDKMVPGCWRNRWFIPLPKKPENPTLEELRPIVPLEVTRKCCTGLNIASIMEQVEKHNVLSEAEHEFRRKRGTHTANLQIQNPLETEWQHKKQINGSSWDTSKAFDSVGRPLIRLA